MEKEYVVACAYEERSALLDAAEFLNGRMREIRDSGKLVGHDRIAVMVDTPGLHRRAHFFGRLAEVGDVLPDLDTVDVFGGEALGQLHRVPRIKSNAAHREAFAEF